MKKIILIIWILFFWCYSVFAWCEYSWNPLDNFKNCSPENVIEQWSNPRLDVTDSGSDFITLIKKVVNRIQVIAFYIAVGIIVWLGFMMVVPWNAEAKESTKWKLVSVLIGFLVMIGATIIVNAIINILYEIF